MRLPFDVLGLVSTLTGVVASTARLRERQYRNVNITFEDVGGNLDAAQPLVCVEAFVPIMRTYAQCYDVNSTRAGADPNRPNGVFDPSYSPPCLWLCSEGNYTRFTQCINCGIANGADTLSESRAVLDIGNQLCEGKLKTTVTEITAVPTTTAAIQTSFTQATLTLPVWTGLADYVPEDRSEVPAQGSSSTSSSASLSSLSSLSRLSSAPTASASGAAAPGLFHSGRAPFLSGAISAILGLLLL